MTCQADLLGLTSEPEIPAPMEWKGEGALKIKPKSNGERQEASK